MRRRPYRRRRKSAVHVTYRPYSRHIRNFFAR